MTPTMAVALVLAAVAEVAIWIALAWWCWPAICDERDERRAR